MVGQPARRSRWAALVAAAMTAALLAGCSSSSPNPGPSASDSRGTSSSTSGSTTTPPPTSGSPPATTSSSAPADPRVAAAVKAYESFMNAYNVAELHPTYAAAGSFVKYSFDPARADASSEILFLVQGHLKYVGTPPTPRLSVAKVDLAAAPYPTVTVVDCPTAPASWKVVATSGPPPTTRQPKARPPYKITAQVILYEKHWGVQKMTVDSTRTCSP